jgi:hypothetical protein
MIFTAIASAATGALAALGSAVVITGGQVLAFTSTVALTIGASALNRAPPPRLDRSYGTTEKGMEMTMRAGANVPRDFVFGQTGVPGSLHYECASGSNNEFLWRVIVLADHPCEGLAGLWVDDEYVAWQPSAAGDVETFVVASKTSGGVEHLRITLYKGRPGQTANQDLIAAANGEWTAADILDGVTYAITRTRFSRSVWRDGVPNLFWDLKGALLYDLRQDSSVGGSGNQRWGQPSTYGFNANNCVVLYNYLRGHHFGADGLPMHGMGWEAERLPVDRWIAAINACDQAVPLRLGGSEPRYRAHGIIPGDMIHDDAVDLLCQSMAGDLVNHSGLFIPVPGVARVPVMTVTDDRLVRGAEINRTEKQSPANLTNQVTGAWLDPKSRYQSVEIGMRSSSADIAADGGMPRTAKLRLRFCASSSQAQRCAEIKRRRARRQDEVSAPFSRRLRRAKCMDWISWQSDRFGTNKFFEISSVAPTERLERILNLREIDPEVYDWDPTVDEQIDAEAVDLPSGAAPLVSVSNPGVAAAEIPSPDGTRTPAIRVTWTPITDPTVTGAIIRYKTEESAVWQSYTASRDQLLAGSATIEAGVVGGARHVATVELITDPPRRMVRVDAGSTVDVTQPVVVNRAQTSTITEQVLPGVITPDSLIADFRLRLEDPSLRTLLLQTAISLQSRIEEVSRGFNIVTGKIRSDVLLGLNPLSADITKLDQEIAEVERQIASVSTALSAQTAGVAAALDQEIAARTTAVQAEAVDRTAAVAQLADDITAIETSIALLVDESGTSATDTTRLAVQQANANTMALRAALAEAVRDGDLDRDERRRFGIVSAQVTETREANTRQDEALAKFTLDLIAETNARTTQLAAVNTTLSALTNADQALAQRATLLEAEIQGARQGQADVAARLTQLDVARAQGDTALAGRAAALEATVNNGSTGVNAVNARLTTEEQARANADTALASTLTNVSARADQATAEGLMSMVAVATASGASASFRIRLRTALNGTWRETGQRMDIMPDGSTRIEFDAGKIINRTEQLQIASPNVNSGAPIDVFTVKSIDGVNRFVFNEGLQISVANLREELIGDMNFGFNNTLLPPGGGATGLLNVQSFNVPAGNNTAFRLTTHIDQVSLLSSRLSINVGDTNILNGKVPSIYIEVPAQGGTTRRIDFAMFGYVPSWPNIGADGSPRAGGIRRAQNNIPVFIPASNTPRTCQIKWGWIIDVDRSNLRFDCNWLISASLFG